MTLLRNVTAVTLNERREIVDDAAIKIDGTRFRQLENLQTTPKARTN